MQYKTTTIKIDILFWITLVLFIISTTSNYSQTTLEREFDEDFKERYSSEKFNYEGTEVVRYTRTGSGKYEEYKNENTKPELEEVDNSNEVTGDLSGLRFLNLIFIAALIIAVFYLVYILMNEGGASIFNTKKNTEISTQEEFNVENIAAIDIEALIANAEKNADYRLAVRFYHMLVLKRLSIKNFIKLEEDKTNEEYYFEVKDKSFKNDFKFTCYLYDYVWYGEFPINLRQYQVAKQNFVQLINKVA